MKNEVLAQLNGKRLFLTGGTGFFGKSFLECIGTYKKSNSLDLDLVILTRNSSAFIEKNSGLYDPSWISFHEGDIQSFSFPKEKFDHILHFATPADATWNVTHPLEMFDTIVNGTRRVLDFAAQSKVKSVLFASSGAVYGKQPSDCTHVPETYLGAPDLTQANSSYGEGKRVAEYLGNTYSRKHGFDFKIARCFAFAGPHLDPDAHYAIGNFIRDAVSGKPLTIQGDGTPHRSFLYSDDLVTWLTKILLDGKNSTPYNVGSDEDLSIKELATKIIKILNLSNEIVIKSAPTAGKPVERYVPSIDLAKKDLGLKVYTSLDDSIKLTAAAFTKKLGI
jgi:nucleoside-diphosphate-sugar epimerase